MILLTMSKSTSTNLAQLWEQKRELGVPEKRALPQTPWAGRVFTDLRNSSWILSALFLFSCYAKGNKTTEGDAAP